MSLRPFRDALSVAVPLYGRGVIRAYTLVDLADEPLMHGRRWHLTSGGYARANRSGGGMDYLHRLLLGLVDGDERQAELEAAAAAAELRRRLMPFSPEGDGRQ